MPDTQRRLSCIALLPAFMLACVLVLGGVSGAFVLSHRVETVYGPPRADIGAFTYLRLAWSLLRHEADLTRPLGPSDAPPVEVVIREGEALPFVAARLKQAGLIANTDAWLDYLNYSGLDRHILAGRFRLSAALSPVDIARRLQSREAMLTTFTMQPGWRIEEAAEALALSSPAIQPQAFIEHARTPPADFARQFDLPPGATLEGFLFPGSYDLTPDITVEALLDQMLSAFRRAMTPERVAVYRAQGLTVYQAVTLASIVQREAVLEDEMPLIASVFYNRLRRGMALEADPTVQYALGYSLGYDTWWPPLTAADLRLDSPYNTYRFPGLPPGPIASPGEAALQAVAAPAQTDYLFFRAACDGSGRHRFAATYQEHLQNACP